MNLSASRIGTIFDCPRKYKYSYVDYITPVGKKDALEIGSAVHWGIENNTSDLTEYFKKVEFTLPQLLAESMTNCYLRERDKIKAKIFEGLDIPEKDIMEYHEFEITASLTSKMFKPHSLLGIVDLMYVTPQGVIIVDYKTSSQKPNYDDYLPQIYTYKYLVEDFFKDLGLKVIRMAIINIRKAGIRQTQKETIDDFKKRLTEEYILNSETYLDTYIFREEGLDEEGFSNFLENLTQQGDFLQAIVKTGLYPMNFGACNKYGSCEFRPLCMNQPGAMELFKKKY